MRGRLRSLPRTQFTLDFYASAAADPSGYGEGQRWLGSIVVTTNSSGVYNFDELLREASTPGEFVTATATEEPAGNTSEFSEAEQVVGRTARARVARSSVARIASAEFVDAVRSRIASSTHELAGAIARGSSRRRDGAVLPATSDHQTGPVTFAVLDVVLAMKAGAATTPAISTTARLLDLLSDEELLELMRPLDSAM